MWLIFTSLVTRLFSLNFSFFPSRIQRKWYVINLNNNKNTQRLLMNWNACVAFARFISEIIFLSAMFWWCWWLQTGLRNKNLSAFFLDLWGTLIGLRSWNWSLTFLCCVLLFWFECLPPKKQQQQQKKTARYTNIIKQPEAREIAQSNKDLYVTMSQVLAQSPEDFQNNLEKVNLFQPLLANLFFFFSLSFATNKQMETYDSGGSGPSKPDWRCVFSSPNTWPCWCEDSYKGFECLSWSLFLSSWVNLSWMASTNLQHWTGWRNFRS